MNKENTRKKGLCKTRQAKKIHGQRLIWSCESLAWHSCEDSFHRFDVCFKAGPECSKLQGIIELESNFITNFNDSRPKPWHQQTFLLLSIYIPSVAAVWFWYGVGKNQPVDNYSNQIRWRNKQPFPVGQTTNGLGFDKSHRVKDIAQERPVIVSRPSNQSICKWHGKFGNFIE